MKRIYLFILTLCFAYGLRAQTIGGSNLVCPGSTVNYTSAQAGDWTVTGGTIVGNITDGVSIQWSSSPGSGVVRLSWEEPVNNGDMISKSITLAVTITSPSSTNGSVNSLSVCSGSGGQVTLSGYSGTILKWQRSTNNGVNWTDISNTTYTQTFSALTTATQFRAYIAGTCNNAYSSAGTVSVIAPTVGGNAQGDATVYNGAYFSSQINLVNQTGTVVQWEKSINAGASWAVINSTTTSLAYSSQNLGQTTQFRALVKNQTCASQYSSVATVTVLPLIQGVTQACPDVEYHYNLGAYVSNPTWSIQGGQIVRQDDETSIYVVWDASIGSKVLSVEFVTGVVNGETLTDGRTLTVSMNSIARGGAPTGPGTVCAGDAATLTLQNYSGTILRWEVQSATTWQSLGGAGSSTFAVVPTGSQSFRAVVDGGVCGEKYSSPLPVTAILRPQVSVSPGARFGSGAVSLSATSDLSLATFAWFSQPASGTPLFTGATYQPVVGQSQVYYVEADNAGCKSSSRAQANASVYAMPQILFNGAAGNQAPFFFYQGDAAVLSTSEVYDQYQWKRNGINLSSQNQVTISQAGSYSLTVSRGQATAVATASVQYYNTPGALNYVKEYSPLTEGATTQEQAKALGVNDVQKQISYIDGLGKEQQHILISASPNHHDIVQVKEYDPLGRENKSYLPYAGQTGDGLYKLNARKRGTYSTGDQFAFYNGTPTSKVATDSSPFSETIFESSPLNRPLQDYGPGQSWKGNSKAVVHAYPLNDASAEPVIAWSLNGSGLPVRSTLTNVAVSGGYYASGQLHIKSTTDEQGNEVREFTDKEGHTILKKVEVVAGAALNSSTGWTQTYYIYDDFGLLRYVLQPELVKKLVTASTWADPTAADLGKFAFIYKYDARKRMVTKKVPGADSVLMIYDKRDRLVLTQDGNQRTGVVTAIKYWTFTKYDALNRPILTGIKDTTIATATSEFSRVQMQAVVDAHFAKASAAWSETFVGTTANGNIHGYTNKAYPVITGSTAGEKDPNKYLTVTYYDNYIFRNDWPSTYTYINDGLSSTVNSVSYTQPGNENLNVVGHPTGSKTKVLDGGVPGGYTWLRAINYYDDKYRVIQTQADNYKGGKDIVSNLYDFAGKVLKSKETQTITTMQNLVAVKQVGNKWINIATTAAWGNSGFSSIQQLGAGQDGWMEFTASESNNYRMLGLSSSDPNANYNSITFAIYLYASNVIYVYEGGVSKGTFGTYANGDVFRVQRNGTTIKYFRNNVLFYTSASTSTTALMVDASFYHLNSTLVNIRTSFSSGARTITHTYVYDHSQRLTEQWHQVDNGTNYRTVFNQYNEIGQLVDKKLHSTQANGNDAKQSVDYRYNIRGWLTSMNNSQLANDGITNDDATDLFGMNLLYEQSDANLASAGLFNGNISGMKWSSNLGLGDTKETGYNFTYDALNRLQHANSRMNKTSTWQAGNYHENNLQYDLNGNITALQRFGDGGNQIDNLVYNYGVAGATGNQLVYVKDNTTNAANKVKGFADGYAGTNTEYTYDANGNMTRDLNKGIGTSVTDGGNLITYNYLNLPEVVVKAGNSIRYIYTAAGQKLTQVATSGGSIKQTDYVGAYVYENDVLQFINHEEGRVAVGSNQLIYSNSFNTTTSMTAANTALGTATGTNGETYVTVTAPATGMTVNSGVTGIGGTYAVQPGERYKVRVKGYRTAHAANLQITAGSVLASPGTALPSPNSAYESWVEQIVTIPASVTAMTIGVVWTVAPSASEVLYLNELEVTKLTTNATPEYQYHLKDHLGNVRLTFTTQITTKTFTAGFETGNQTTEASNFSNYQTNKISTLTPTNPNATTGNSAYYLNGGYAGQVGLTKSLSVMPGDQVSIQANVRYNAPTTTAASFTSFAASLLSAFNLATPAGGETGTAASGVNTFASWETGATGNESKSDAIKAFATIILFDRNYNFLDVAYQAVQANGTVSVTYTAKQPGYAYIYISNEHPYLMDVYFDDVNVTFTPSAVIQVQDYYPFGLKFNSFARENTVPNNMKLFQNQEHIDDLGLNWDAFKWRNHQPDIGRFFNVDPLAAKYVYNSPYAFAENRVIDGRELEGLEWVRFNGKTNDVIYNPKANDGKGAYTKYATNNDKRLGASLQGTKTGQAQFAKLVNSDHPIEVKLNFSSDVTYSKSGKIEYGHTTNEGHTEMDANSSPVKFDRKVDKSTVTLNIASMEGTVKNGGTFGNSDATNLNFDEFLGAVFGHEIEHTTLKSYTLDITGKDSEVPAYKVSDKIIDETWTNIEKSQQNEKK